MNINTKSLLALCALLSTTLLGSCAHAQNNNVPSTALTKNGQALLPIVLSPNATDKEKELALKLANYLQQISGGTFKVETSTKVLSADVPGIAIGTGSEFPDLADQFDVNDPTRSEDYLLRSHKNGVLLVGAGDLAVEHAVWDFLYRMGHRQFFPGKDWEVIPNEKNLRISVNTMEHPDYYSRRAGSSWVTKENRPKWADWIARNRMGSGLSLSTGHAYGGIIRRNKAEFEKHPEYFTKPGSGKFCVSNPGLQKLVIADALAQFEKNPNLQSISMDPSDGGGWESDSCPDATIYKSVTDRVVTLANIVAEAVTKKYPAKFVGIYAYNEHSPPPSIKVHSHVVPSIATSFIRGGFTADELFTGWGGKSKWLGVREYYSVNVWNRDLPGRSRGSSIDYLQRTIPHFYQRGARFMTPNFNESWGANGLGFYIASRLLWNTKDATHVDEIKADFFEKAFGPAKEPMARFYQLIDGSNKPLLSADLIGRMYRQLNDALKLANDAAIRARIANLALYTHYVELYSDYSQAKGAERQAAFETLMRYTWRIRYTQMTHTIALWKDLANRDKSVQFPESCDYKTPEGTNPWKSSEPFTAAQIQSYITNGVANNELLAFTPVSFSEDLVPAKPLHLSSGKAGEFGTLRGNFNLYTWVNQAPATITLEVTAGRIYQNRGPAKFELFPSAETLGNSVALVEVSPDRQPHQTSLKSTFEGLQRIAVSDADAGTILSWVSGTPMTLNTTQGFPNIVGRWTLYFYVPKGTTVIGGYRSAGGGSVKSPDGKTAFTFTGDNNPGYWSVSVPPGQDGKLWQLASIRGAVKLMTVPPYLARSADELLLPAEIVKADGK